jgi:hypothetical protein
MKKLACQTKFHLLNFAMKVFSLLNVIFLKYSPMLNQTKIQNIANCLPLIAFKAKEILLGICFGYGTILTIIYTLLLTFSRV